MTAAVIDIKDLCFAYRGQSVLENVNLEIQQGDFTAIIGPNGGGKTTLLKLILGLLKPDQGTIRILGYSPQKAAHHIGYVPQNVNVNRSFPITALDVVLMGNQKVYKKWSKNSAGKRREALEALEQMKVADFAGCKIRELSSGQLQRVFIARALVTQPQLLLLDEPTASIDTKGQADFYNHLKHLNKQITIVMVSHDLMAISTHVKSVTCVNKCLHYHSQAEISDDMLQTMYPCTEENICPVELVAHGLPHRVLQHHEE